jgi:hypothetical protein
MVLWDRYTISAVVPGVKLRIGEEEGRRLLVCEPGVGQSPCLSGCSYVESLANLTTPGKEGKKDEIAYEAAKADVTDKRKEFFEEMLNNIVFLDELKDSFENLYCSMKKAHVCMDGSCRGCGDEEVEKNKDSMEDCNLKEEGHGKKEDAKKKDSSGAQEGRRILKLTTILGICA